MNRLQFFYNKFIELLSITVGILWGLFLAVLIFFIVYLCEKHISEELIPYIMYPSIILVIVFGFMYPKKIDRFFSLFFWEKEQDKDENKDAE